MDEAQVGKAINEELHSEGDEEEAHDADQNADPGLAEEGADAIGAVEDEVAGERGESDGGENRQHLPVVGGLANEDHHARNSAGAGEHGDAEGDDASVLAGCGVFGFCLRFLGGGAAGLHHVDADEHEEEAAGDLKGGELDAEEREDELTSQGKGDEDDEAGEGGFARSCGW